MDNENQELVKKTLQNLLETNDRDKQKSTIKKLPFEQLDLLNKVTKKELDNEIKKSNVAFDKDVQEASDDVKGYNQFYSGPTERSISKQENKLTNISGDIAKEISERNESKIKQQEAQQDSGQSSKETSDIRENKKSEAGLLSDKTKEARRPVNLPPSSLSRLGAGAINTSRRKKPEKANEASARLSDAIDLKNIKKILEKKDPPSGSQSKLEKEVENIRNSLRKTISKTEDPIKYKQALYKKALDNSTEGLAKQNQAQRSKSPPLDTIPEGVEPSISSSKIDVSIKNPSQKDERKPDPPGEHLEKLLASRQNQKLEK